jgi:glucose dehydrogenase
MSLDSTTPTASSPTASSDLAVQQLCSALRTLLILLGTVLAGHGLGDSGLYFWVELAAGGVMILGPGAWGVWNAYLNVVKTRKRETLAVRAGVALQQAAMAGAISRGTGNGAIVPELITHAEAQSAIVAFAEPRA